MWVGFFSLEVLPSPKYHLYIIPLFIEVVLVKMILELLQSVLEVVVKLGVGLLTTETVFTKLSLQLVPFVATKLT